MTAPPSLDRDRLLSLRQVLQTVPVDERTLRRWEAAGLFPRRMRFNGRNYWSELELQEWIHRCKRARAGGRPDVEEAQQPS